ncbi:hypothetical protein DFH09DRAFT_533640 [Mycena vulgaris]|nr:hypothetical protein DFH09DRAFT_533640 [Mycena vulgaris]
MKKGRYQEAYVSFKRLRTELQVARDLYYVHRQLMEEFAVLRGSTHIMRFPELFTIPRVRRAALASFVVVIVQQVCICITSLDVCLSSIYTLKAKKGSGPIQEI